MTGDDICRKALSYKTYVYWYGAKGQKCTQALLNQLASQYPGIYTVPYVRKCRDDILQKRQAIDCSGLVCKSYGIKDVSTYGMPALFRECHGTPANGMICWRTSHCGIYYNGKVIEARGIDYDVTDTRAYKPENWEKVLYMPEVVYSTGKKERSPQEYLLACERVLAGTYGNGSERQAKLTAEGYSYNKIQQIINILYE